MWFDIDYSHAKTMATRLQSFLEGSPKNLSRSSAIEAVAQMLGFNNRNEMAARIDAETTIDQSPQQSVPITAPDSFSDIPLDKSAEGTGCGAQCVAMRAIEETKDWPIGISVHDSLQRRVKEIPEEDRLHTSGLEFERRLAADEEVQNYEFDLSFKGSNRWEFTTGEDEWSCTVFLEDPENPDAPSLRGVFMVIFAPNSAKAITAYATVRGDDVGHRPAARAAASKRPVTTFERNTMPNNFIRNDPKSKKLRKEEIEKTAALILEHALEHAPGKTFQDAIYTEIPNEGISVIHCVEQKLLHRFLINMFATAELALAFDGLEMAGAKDEGFHTPHEKLARTLVNHSLDRAEQMWNEAHS